MKFDFKNSDQVRCKVLRPTMIARKPVALGAIVEVDGWTAKQGMSGPNPALARVEGHAPEPYVERDREVIIENRDPPPPSPVRKKAKKPRAPVAFANND